MSRISRQTQNPVCTTSAVRKHLNMSKAAGPALVLERSLGARAGVDAQLWASLPFCAEVIPDLPVASSWWGLYQSAIKKFSRCVRLPPDAHRELCIFKMIADLQSLEMLAEHKTGSWQRSRSQRQGHVHADCSLKVLHLPHHRPRMTMQAAADSVLSILCTCRPSLHR
jgi:hypothetical protein